MLLQSLPTVIHNCNAFNTDPLAVFICCTDFNIRFTLKLGIGLFLFPNTKIKFSPSYSMTKPKGGYEVCLRLRW